MRKLSRSCEIDWALFPAYQFRIKGDNVLKCGLQAPCKTLCRGTRTEADGAQKEEVDKFKNDLNRSTLLAIVSINNGRFNPEI